MKPLQTRYIHFLSLFFIACTATLYSSISSAEQHTEALLDIVEALRQDMENGNTATVEKHYSEQLLVLSKGKRIEPLRKDILNAIRQQKKIVRHEVHTLSNPMVRLFPDGKTAWVTTHQKRKVFEKATDKQLEISEISTLYVFHLEGGRWLVSAIAESDDGQVVKE